MPTTLTILPRRPAALRVIRQWIFGERALRGPAAIELDVLDQQVTRAVADVQQCAAESETIEHHLDHARAAVHAALTDAETPGVITAAESRHVFRELIDTTILAHAHTAQLQALM
ncbi:MAG: hypothetical protein H7343_12205 [Undibacterium sp.]|nr:hypothetical protein [Opitutaceae bacterium]